MNKPTLKASTFANRYKQTHRPKFAKELAFYYPRKIELKKIPSLLKILKTQLTTDTQTYRQLTAKHTTDKDFTTSTDRTPAGNSGLAKVAVQCFV
ncbi:MAG: hypothetical protein IPK88_09460 [Saprospiraceae bacterium]|nr:hypothetical protein [Candidatus Defluviibacterium haderslevense]